MHPETQNNDLQNPSKEPETANTTGTALNTLSTAVFYLAILFFIIGFNFSDVMVGNWYQQFMPSNLGSQQINDITFLDSLTGFAVASRNVNPDTSSILRTTNGGNNWQIIQTLSPRRFSKINFINNSIGFISGGSGTGTPYLYKTIDGGNSWNVVIGATLGTAYWNDMSVLNEDTIWLVDGNSINGGVFLTANSGTNWSQQLNIGSNNPDKIYMYNARIGFISRTNSPQLRKTTNGGVNWNLLSGTGTGAFSDIYFIDSLTGWKAKAVGGGGWLMGKSTDGGINWVEQNLPSGGNIVQTQIRTFININKDTIWGVGSALLLNSQFRGILTYTSTGGDNWLFQLPDTSIHIGEYNYIDFANKFNGWAYRNTVTGIHTTNGGDTTFYLGLQQTSSNIPKEFELKQNYPNPFNPRTVIPYKFKKSAFVRLIAYEITGKETQIMVNQNQQAGEYEVDFIGKFAISSGIYFYRIEVTDDKSKQLYTETKKMVLIK